MMSMEQTQALTETLRGLYTDVRLLDADTILRIREGGQPSPKDDFCFACRHMQNFGRVCAAKQALATKQSQCRIEFYGSSLAHITSRYYEIDGKPYVLELVQSSPCQATLDTDTGEQVLRELSGYNTKLYRDALTGAYNRRYYEEVARLTSGPACVALLDLDDFKVCNDTYGHSVGDLALKTAARAIRACMRDPDTLIRYGGDEFLLILPGVSGDYLPVILEKIRTEVSAAAIPGYAHIHLSVSIGSVTRETDETMESTVQRADKLMYRAKEHKHSVVSVRVDAALPDPGAVQEKAQILVVDDSVINRAMLSAILGEDYRILEAADGKQGLELLQRSAGEIALVLLDINMPVMNGFEVLHALNDSHAIEDTPVIMISCEDSTAAIRKAFELGASDYVSRPFDAKIVYQRVFNTIKLYAKQRRLVQLVSDQIHTREKNAAMLVGVLSQIVEFRSGESGSHVRTIRRITERLLRRLMEVSTAYHISSEQQEDIPLASALHDIGKIALDEHLLSKPGRLTAEELALIKTHTTQGAAMLRRLDGFEAEPLLQTAYEIARWHHERWDGRGYPDGLNGDQIPISAQIVSLADVYETLTGKRGYKEACSHETALDRILHGECGSFNPVLLTCLLDIQEDLKNEVQ